VDALLNPEPKRFNVNCVPAAAVVGETEVSVMVPLPVPVFVTITVND
jgi:hypothetical protein